MTVRLKTLILLVALVALPLRGMAAVAMWHCAQGDARGTMSQPAGEHEGGHHHAAAEGGADHSAHHDQPDHDVAAQDGPAGHAAHATSACSACAACCIGGAVAPSAWQSLSFAPIGASRSPFAEQRFTGFVPAQPDRPPLLQRL